MNNLTYYSQIAHSIFNTYMISQLHVCRYVHQCLEVEEILANCVRKNHIYLFHGFSKLTKDFKKWFNIDDKERHVMNHLLLITFAIIKNYKLKNTQK
jgi:hypothetical protein